MKRKYGIEKVHHIVRHHSHQMKSTIHIERGQEWSKSIIWVLWLVLVVVWNYKYPNASPQNDVLVALFLSLWSRALERHIT